MKYILTKTFWRRYVKYGRMKPPYGILTQWMSIWAVTGLTKQVFQVTGPKTLFPSSFWLSLLHPWPVTQRCLLRRCIQYGLWWKCHWFYWSICTTSWKRATLLFTCLAAMLHRGLIGGVDRSCNLKRGHCSSEQKQLKENERQPPRVKNRKLSTCMLESTTLHPA